MANDAGGAMERAKDGVGNMVNDGKNMVQNGAEGAKNAVNNMTNAASDTLRGEDGRENNAYTAARTSATNDFSASNPVILWTILAVIALAIIGVVWFYGVQTQKGNH